MHTPFFVSYVVTRDGASISFRNTQFVEDVSVPSMEIVKVWQDRLEKLTRHDLQDRSATVSILNFIALAPV